MTSTTNADNRLIQVDCLILKRPNALDPTAEPNFIVKWVDGGKTWESESNLLETATAMVDHFTTFGKDVRYTGEPVFAKRLGHECKRGTKIVNRNDHLVAYQVNAKVKRGRGRPRKRGNQTDVAGISQQAAVVKRGRGRPRKRGHQTEVGTSLQATVMKRPRGRPRKRGIISTCSTHQK